MGFLMTFSRVSVPSADRIFIRWSNCTTRQGGRGRGGAERVCMSGICLLEQKVFVCFVLPIKPENRLKVLGIRHLELTSMSTFFSVCMYTYCVSIQ